MLLALASDWTSLLKGLIYQGVHTKKDTRISIRPTLFVCPAPLSGPTCIVKWVGLETLVKDNLLKYQN